MAKTGELAHVVSGRIWRTVVVAGAMLGAPLVMPACGGGTKPATTTPADTTAQDKAAADKAAADKAAADAAAAQPRPRANNNARPVGRGFILA